MDLSAQERSALEQLSEAELFANLAQSQAGVAGEFGIQTEPQGAFKRRDEMLGEMQAAGLWDDIVAHGKAVFETLWTRARSVVCALYDELTRSGSIGELLDEAANAITKALGLPIRVAYLLVRAAMKAGLDALCAIKAMPVR